MRLISFRHTVRQVWNRQKTETRRLLWDHVRVGDLLLGVVQSQGIRPGESVQPLHIIRVEATWREPLKDITEEAVEREGFPLMSPAEFCVMFSAIHPKLDIRDPVRVIQFSFVPGGRFPMPTLREANHA